MQLIDRKKVIRKLDLEDCGEKAGGCYSETDKVRVLRCTFRCQSLPPPVFHMWLPNSLCTKSMPSIALDGSKNICINPGFVPINGFSGIVLNIPDLADSIYV
jgi:hypothetical protein